MPKYMILVEGKSDAVFLRDYLKFLIKDVKLVKDKSKDKLLEINDISITIVAVGGFTSVTKHLRVKIKEIIDFKYKILILQDADDSHIDYGGVQKRNEYLKNIKEELGIDFETFLFPNNKDDGDLETLLLQLVNEEKYGDSISCYENYVECIRKISKSEFNDELLENKNKVFSYFRTYFGMEHAKEENREFSLEYWDFSSDVLIPFKVFLDKTIQYSL